MNSKSINEWAKEIHSLACEKGWWENERSFGEIIALCHSELSEALEEDRAGNPMEYFISHELEPEMIVKGSDGNTYKLHPLKQLTKETDTTKWCGEKPDGVAVELIDCIIRILDYLAYKGVDVEAVLARKHEYNKGREYRHGGKKY
jgi:hypothetical protein